MIKIFLQQTSWRRKGFIGLKFSVTAHNEEKSQQQNLRPMVTPYLESRAWDNKHTNAVCWLHLAFFTLKESRTRPKGWGHPEWAASVNNRDSVPQATLSR